MPNHKLIDFKAKLIFVVCTREWKGFYDELIFIDNLIRQRMGDIYTKPVQDELLTQLQLTYESYSQSSYIPGEPTHLKIKSSQSMVSPLSQIFQKYPKIDRYYLALKLSQQDLRNQKRIYEYRKANYPCVVQVIHVQLEKQDFYCINNGYKLAVFTEHVETRLANYRLTKHSKKSSCSILQKYESFTQDEGIYVLINTLHAYQLLCEQYQVNYPTPFSIGITERAKVKVWINENWALNTPNNRKITENLIIEEIINLVQERMEGSFSKILNYKYNYMKFSFDSIQDLLSSYTINFHKGKQTLEQKISGKNSIEEGYQRISCDTLQLLAQSKISADNLRQSIQKQGKVEFRVQKQMQKRHYSQQCLKHNSNYILLPSSYSCSKSIQTQKYRNQPLKNTINFKFRSQQPSSKQLSKLSVSSKQTCPVTSDNSFSYSNSYGVNQTGAKAAINLSVSNKSQVSWLQTSIAYPNTIKPMQKRQFETAKSDQYQKRYSCSSSNTSRQIGKNQSPIKTFLDCVVSPRLNDSNSLSPKDSVKPISHNLPQQHLPESQQKGAETLSSITEQFKNLLQLGKKTSVDEDLKQVQFYQNCSRKEQLKQIDAKQQKKNKGICLGQSLSRLKSKTRM